MKVENKDLLVCIKIGLDIVWYLCLIGAILGPFTLMKHLYGSMWFESTIPVRLSSTLERYYPAINIHGSDVSVQATSGVVMIMNHDPIIALPGLILLILHSLLTIAVLYNLRKVFGTIYRKEPFQYKNISRLKVTALYIALFCVLELVANAVYYLMLKNYNFLVLKSYHRIEKFHVQWAFSKGYLEVAAIVYIMAEILRYGLELKNENEAFV